MMNLGLLFGLFSTKSETKKALENFALDNPAVKPTKTCFVAKNGNDTTGDGSFNKPYLTVSKAASSVDGSGWLVVIAPGTYAENPTFSAANVSITSIGVEQGSLVNIAGTLTFSQTISSARAAGISATNIAHAGAGNLYLKNCRSSTALTSTGSGYLFVQDCDTQGSGTGTISITGAGSKVIKGGTVGLLTVNNANALVSVDGQVSASPMTLTAGTLALGVGPIYSANATANALTATGGTLILDGATFLAPTGASARISVGANVIYDLITAKLDSTNSTFAGTQANLYNIKTRLGGGGKVTYQSNSTTYPASPSSGDWLLVTSDGTSAGTIKEQWLRDATSWVLVSGSLPVSGAVLDNTISNSAAVVDVGRYIVPASALAGQFVGRANQYADWDGSSWTFTAPTNNTTVSISNGPNANQIWKFTTTGGWAKNVTSLSGKAVAASFRIPTTGVSGGQTKKVPLNLTQQLALSGIAYSDANDSLTILEYGLYEVSLNATGFSGAGAWTHTARVVVNGVATLATSSASGGQFAYANYSVVYTGYALPGDVFSFSIESSIVSDIMYGSVLIKKIGD